MYLVLKTKKHLYHLVNEIEWSYLNKTRTLGKTQELLIGKRDDELWYKN